MLDWNHHRSPCAWRRLQYFLTSWVFFDGGGIRSGLCICCIDYTGVGQFYLLFAKRSHSSMIHELLYCIGVHMIYDVHREIDLMKRHFLTRNICAWEKEKQDQNEATHLKMTLMESKNMNEYINATIRDWTVRDEDPLVVCLSSHELPNIFFIFILASNERKSEENLARNQSHWICR